MDTRKHFETVGQIFFKTAGNAWKYLKVPRAQTNFMKDIPSFTKIDTCAGPAERFFLKWGCSTSKEKLERSERSERSVNWRGVQGPAVGSSEVLYICIQSDGTIRLSWDPFVTLSGHIPKIDGSHRRMQVEVIPNIQILQIGYIVELKRKYWWIYFVLLFSPQCIKS